MTDTESLARLGVWIAVATCAATIIGPIAAVQAQSWLDRKRAAKSRKIGIFRVLMTRRLELSPEVIQAFNAVPIEFYGEEDVLKAWRTYLQHMNTPTDAPQWFEHRVDHFMNLLQKMATHLGYEIEFVALKNDFYSPSRHQVVENDNEVIRQGLAAVLSGKARLPLDLPVDEEMKALLKKFLQQSIEGKQYSEGVQKLAEAMRKADARRRAEDDDKDLLLK